MMADIILLGRSGQVATAVAALAATTGRNIRQLARPAFDLSNPDSIAPALEPVLAAAAPGSVLVNATAYTDVNRAEAEPDLAHTLNALAPGILAENCRQAGMPLIHLSTDYVYDGTKGAPYVETDACNPLSVYGRTKLAGDEAVMRSGARHVILRTSAVYSATGKNFVRTMLELGRRQDHVRVVADQSTNPTAAANIATAILEIADRLAMGTPDGGVFHFCGDTSVSWADFATEIFGIAEGLGERAVQVGRIAAKEFASPAARPAFSVLDCGAIADRFGISQPDHGEALARAITLILAGGTTGDATKAC
ncbi:dTDP-4-dehydrorhamnose reductase [Maricaulis sp.]|uniref:dTDP-4-dehydrorhamnose reductase n=1 Tax=Maricaulis sp. TaxID=1486257 RepID=UPI003A8CF8BC